MGLRTQDVTFGGKTLQLAKNAILAESRKRFLHPNLKYKLH